MNSEIDRSFSKFVTGLATLDQIDHWFSTPKGAGLSICGRSNVGKSSIINWLFKNKMAFVSNTPGKTREINVFEVKFINSDHIFYLYDLPGYGHARVSKEQKKHWNTVIPYFFSKLTQEDLIIQIQDARHLLTGADHDFISLVTQYEPKKCLFINKWDKLKKQKEKAQANKIIKNDILSIPGIAYIFKTSATEGLGKPEVLQCFNQYFLN
jgi:GTP-binding protein